MKRALISVSNKENLIAFVTQLISFNYEINIYWRNKKIFRRK